MPFPGRLRNVLLLAAGIVTMSGVGSAQTLPFGVSHIGTEEGLSSDVVTALLVDSRGLLWIGTMDGLNRYDGIEFRVYRFDPEDSLSLSSNWITGLSEDRSGYIWVSTFAGGLCRLHLHSDTFSCYPFAPPLDRSTLANQEVHLAIEDRLDDDIIWVATGCGLDRLDAKEATIEHFARPEPRGDGSNCIYARDLFQDQAGHLWIAATGDGLFRFDTRSATFERFPMRADESGSELYSGPILSVYEAPSLPGRLWLGLNGSLWVMDVATRQLRNIQVPSDTMLGWVHATREDSQGRLWFASDGGLFTLSEDERELRPVLSMQEQPIVRALAEDASGQLWVGCWDEGLYRLQTDRMRTVSFRPTNGDVRSFLSVSDDQLLVGETGGLFTLDTQDTVTSRIRLPGLRPIQLHVDPDGDLWVLTMDSGLLRLQFAEPFETFLSSETAANLVLQTDYDPDRCINLVASRSEITSHTHGLSTASGRMLGRMTHYLARRWYQSTQTARYWRMVARYQLYPNHLYPDPADERILWVSSRRSGIARIDRTGGNTMQWLRNDRGLRTVRTHHFLRDGLDRLWVATDLGLHLYNPSDSSFKLLQPGSTRLSSPVGRIAYSLLPDSVDSSTFWIGTDAGLARFDSSRRSPWPTRRNSQLESRTVHDMVSGRDGSLWLAHRYLSQLAGLDLTRFDPETGSAVTVRIEGALDPIFEDARGRILAGALAGYFALDPGQLAPDSAPPRLIVTAVEVENRPVTGAEDTARRQPLWSGETIRLSPGQRDIRIAYAGLHYRDPLRNRYAFYLDGYDADWRNVGTERVARYTNLPPGSYVFKLRAANSDGVWTDTALEIPIVVLPPWWRTRWANAVYALLLLSILIAVERLRHASIVRRERRRAAVRESQIRSDVAESKAANAEEHARRLEELDDAKSRFFANVSHEFRTPLTMILGVTENAREGRYGRVTRQLESALSVITRNANRANGLVRRLLDLSRLEGGAAHLSARRADMVSSVRAVVRAHVPLAERKGVALLHRLPEKPLLTVFDPEKLETAIGNLVSNAINFTEPGGKVDVSLRRTECSGGDVIRIDVRDTGIGIDRRDLSRIFERFSQVDTSPTRLRGGIGIGLALVREIVQLHGGTVAAESEPGFGSTFSILLPEYGTRFTVAEAGPSNLVSHESVLPEDGEETRIASGTSASLPDDCSELVRLHDEGDGRESDPVHRPSATVLIVEDNADVRAFVREYFEPYFLVVEASDGAEALDLARRDPPDLVIADVMMPVMGGIELCRTLKAEPALQHVPVILLTARAGEANVLEGLSAGADEYVTKPFSLAVLRQSAENLVTSRLQMRDEFSRKVVVEPSGISIEPEYETFLHEIVDVVEEHISDAGYTVDRLADDVGLSRRQLERRLADVCGESPSELIRRMRLERARELLEAAAGTVSEIAYATGYRSPSRFGAAFRRAYGMSPSECRRARETD